MAPVCSVSGCTTGTYVCSLHFSNDNYFKPLIQTMLNYSPQNCRKLKADAIPTLNLPGDELIPSNQVMVNSWVSRTRSPRNSIFTVIECDESKSQDYSCISSAEISGTCLSSGSTTSVLRKRSGHSLKQRSPKFTVSDYIMPTNNDSTTFLKSENMTHSPVPCRRSLFNASPDDITMPDVDYSDEMESQLCVENTNELDEVKKLLEKCQTENIRLYTLVHYIFITYILDLTFKIFVLNFSVACL
ncbi:uncharacterized protein LOC126553519 isoform X2 [Aphis gossypii]|uniref:uncharacterized protein LOC126553519 isoform X2 n=1 Tax=Aphis gossypii TaxID=80765 RepID=UPI002158FBA8|nr:uncharacterized protein LOC126553519 isoform X2 [Aphis gossypii]